MARQGIVLYHGIDSGGELKEYAETAERCGYEFPTNPFPVLK